MLTIFSNNRKPFSWYLGGGNLLNSYLAKTYPLFEGCSQEEYRVIQEQALRNIWMLQADGDELAHISLRFWQRTEKTSGIYTIPMPQDKPIVRWYGDIARTTLLNI